MEILGAVITASMSVLTAIIILQLQKRINKKKTFKALYSEVEGNLNLAQKLLPLAQSIGKVPISGVKVTGTVFDLKRFYTYCYEDFRRSGYLLSLHEKARRLLEEVYEMIVSHNRQTDIMVNQFMRSGGYSERLKVLIEKMKALREQLKSYM